MGPSLLLLNFGRLSAFTCRSEECELSPLQTDFGHASSVSTVLFSSSALQILDSYSVTILVIRYNS